MEIHKGLADTGLSSWNMAAAACAVSKNPHEAADNSVAAQACWMMLGWHDDMQHSMTGCGDSGLLNCEKSMAKSRMMY